MCFLMKDVIENRMECTRFFILKAKRGSKLQNTVVLKIRLFQDAASRGPEELSTFGIIVVP